jgi:transporter family-2 protein
MRFLGLFLIGILAGSMITIQSVLNASLGQRTGNFGSVLLLTIVSIAVLAVLIIGFPATANFRQLPGLSEWYLYIGGALGVGILAAPILLIPRIGATATLTAIVLGQLLLALLIDHFGWLSSPKIEISLLRIVGVLFLLLGAFFLRK